MTSQTISIIYICSFGILKRTETNVMYKGKSDTINQIFSNMKIYLKFLFWKEIQI